MFDVQFDFPDSLQSPNNNYKNIHPMLLMYSDTSGVVIDEEGPYIA